MRLILGTLLLIGFCLKAVSQDQITRPDIPGDLMIDVGLNYWDGDIGAVNQLGWGSKSFSAYYAKKKIFGKFVFNYGLGLSIEKLALENPTNDSYFDFGTNADGPTLTQTALGEDVSFTRYKLGISYLDVPLELRFYPQGTEEGEGLFVGVGVIGGIRLKSWDKLVIDETGDEFKRKEVQTFNLSNFRYGFQARAGFNGIHVFYKHYLSNLFSDPLTLSADEQDDVRLNPTMVTIGINITGF